MVFYFHGEEVVEKKRVRLPLEEAGQMQLAEGKQQDHSAPSAASKLREVVCKWKGQKWHKGKKSNLRQGQRCKSTSCCNM